MANRLLLPFLEFEHLVQITFLKRNKPPRLLFGKRPPQKQRRVSWKRTVSPKSYPRSYPQCPSHAPLTASENATYRASRDRSIGDTSDVWLGGCGNRRNGSKFSELTTGPAPFYNPRVGARSHHALSLPPQGTQQCKFVPPLSRLPLTHFSQVRPHKCQEPVNEPICVCARFQLCSFCHRNRYIHSRATLLPSHL